MYKEYEEASKYPTEIDPLIFYQDITIDKKKYMDEYYRLFSEKKYTEASQYIADKGVDGMFASLMNLLVNRLEATQKHIKTKTKQQKTYFETDRPSSPTYGTIWISKRENEV